MVSGAQLPAAGGEQRIDLDLPSRLNPVHRVTGSPTKLVSQTVAGGSCARVAISFGTTVNVRRTVSLHPTSAIRNLPRRERQLVWATRDGEDLRSVAAERSPRNSG
jgi:hypothetical protein